MKILFIVESPGKVSKISQMLGPNYIVKASVGHFRDLNPKCMSIDFDNNFEPNYIVTKPDVVKTLRSCHRKAPMVYLATDMDLEGHAIAQHLYDVLRLSQSQYKRVTFNAITKPAILEAIKKAGPIDQRMVDAQKARRVLDRLYGYSISGLLSHQLGSGLSAGRVQSVAVRLVIDKENEIESFLTQHGDSTYFHVSGTIGNLRVVMYTTEESDTDTNIYEGHVAHVSLNELTEKNDDPYLIMRTILRRCIKSVFRIRSVIERKSFRQPAPPFETATLQQEANRKFGMSVDVTMKSAQKLYEGGFITYMRTDSTTIAPEAHRDLRKVIVQIFGKNYYRKHDYETKTTGIGTQEAHEAIRPTDPSTGPDLSDDVSDRIQRKLYKLIWQRTIASQMQPAQILVTTIQIDISRWLKYDYDPFYYFQSQIEKILFDGFLRVYSESVDDATDDLDKVQVMKESVKIPKIGQKLPMKKIVAKQEYRKSPPRYTEASMVKMLKKLGIGRPSTYVNTIKTIMTRNYVCIGDSPGISKDIAVLSIEADIDSIHESQSTCLIGKEAKRILSTDLGRTVNTYLLQNFFEMLDYKFTAKIEAQLDAISSGKKVWTNIVADFYARLEPIVTKLREESKERMKEGNNTTTTDRLLGKDGMAEIYVCRSKYGPAVRRQEGDKKTWAKLEPSADLSKVTLNQALELLSYPKILGQLDQSDIVLCKGKHGFYVIYDGNNYSLGPNSKSRSKGKESEPTLPSAIKVIQAKRAAVIQVFDLKIGRRKIQASVIRGQYGPYIQAVSGKTRTNYSVPRHLDPSQFSSSDVQKIIEQQTARPRSSSKSRAKTKTKTK